MSETPDNNPTTADKRPRKTRPRPDSASNTAASPQSANQAANQATGKPKRPPAQKPRRPQSANKSPNKQASMSPGKHQNKSPNKTQGRPTQGRPAQGRPQRNADNFGNHANGNSNNFSANGNRRTANGNRPMQNNRKPHGQNHSQNRNGNSWSYGTDTFGGFDQYRSSDWYREDQARFAAQQIAVERAEAGQKDGNANKNKRNPRNRTARPTRTVATNTKTDHSADTEDSSAATGQQVETVKVADSCASTQPDEKNTEAKTEGKRETGKSRRAPWRTQKHAAGRNAESSKKADESKGSSAT